MSLREAGSLAFLLFFLDRLALEPEIAVLAVLALPQHHALEPVLAHVALPFHGAVGRAGLHEIDLPLVAVLLGVVAGGRVAAATEHGAAHLALGEAHGLLEGL